MEKFYLESCQSGIIIESDLPIKNFLLENQRFIEFPNLKILDNNLPDCRYKLQYFDSINKNLQINNGNMRIEYPIDKVNEYSIIYPSYLLIEKNHYDNHALTCHSACVEKNGRANLFLGKSGSGKTSVALNLCLNYGYKLVANDKTILKLDDNGLFALGGTKFLFLRYESISRNLPYLLPLFSNKLVDNNYSHNNKPIDTWQYKVRFLPEEIGIVESDFISKIDNIYFLHIDDKQEKLIAKKDTSLANRLYLNELLSRTIRGMETTFRNKDNIESGYIESLDCKNYYDLRCDIINYIINIASLEYISGNVDDVCDYINQKQLKR